MKEYIERDSIITFFNNTDWYSINKKGELILGASDGDTALFKANDAFRVLREVPAADVAPVVHGEWVLKDDGRAHCSTCNAVGMAYAWHYCPNCGAKMDGVKLTSTNLSRCRKCVHEVACSKDKDYEGKCPDYKRDAPDGGYYG